MKKIKLSVAIITFTLLFCVIITSFSMYVLYVVVGGELENRMQEAYASNLTQIRISMEDNLQGLASFSHHFTPYGNIGTSIMQYEESDVQVDKIFLQQEIKTEMSVLLFSNNSVSLGALYNDATNYEIATSWPLGEDYDITDLPNLLTVNTMTYYGPHISANKLKSDQIVISSVRKFSANSDIIIYCETPFNITDQIIHNSFMPVDMSVLMLDTDDKIVYTNNSDVFAHGDFFKTGSLNPNGVLGEYTWYQSIANQGWKFVFAINSSDIESLKLGLLSEYLLVFPIILFASLMFCAFVYYKVNRSLKGFNNSIEELKNGNFVNTATVSSVYEIDLLYKQMDTAKTKIRDLIEDVKRTEKLQSQTQLSKLRAQINPHFVLNSLNTIHWLALSKKHIEIDKIVLNLTKLLSYNLRNDKNTTTLGQEIQIIDNYIAIQQNRLDFEYSYINLCDDNISELKIPRFVLQPLVENCILHSNCENLKILLEISYSDNNVLIKIKDNGKGLSEERLNYLNSSLAKPESLGIGLAFVVSTMNDYYHDSDLVHFDLNEENGLTVTLKFIL